MSHAVHDLHSHSTASDGALSPEDLVARAASQGVDVLALTDHDTTAGLQAARQAAAGMNLSLLPGVEISVTWQAATIHVLGLGIDPTDACLNAGLAQAQEFRHWRAGEIGRQLEHHGIEGASEGARQLAHGSIVSRTHFARFLVNNGYARNVRDVFKRFLIKGKPGHVPGQWASLAQALEWIHGAGGVAVIAHPARYRIKQSALRKLISEFKTLGGAAIEVVSGSHDQAAVNKCGRLAEEFQLFASAGSDFHDPKQTWLELGRLPPLPRKCRPLWTSPVWPLPARA